ncbi:zinc-dependent peptidase [Salinisphaera sp.]|uniref:zinc-dependent peptidase n=1 Tax=Salinisphaera sp. TaxID=1914330 RepID=UPI002D7A2FBD|nr:zinc-dependent peptidase [Salinisphaera sp.]HET7313591.1 zinc-dependent peptidase [Salinisphaera sp.]
MNLFTSLLVVAGALVLVALLILGPGWLRRRPSLSAAERRRLGRLMPWTRRLDPRRRARLQARTALILRDIDLLGDSGRALSVDQRLAVAGQVGMLCLGAQPGQGRLPTELVVHANADDEWSDPPTAGLLEDLGEMATGESWQGLRLHVSWPAVVAALDGGPHNAIVRQVARLHDFTAPTTAVAGGQTWGDALDREWRRVRETGSSLLPADEDVALDEFFGQAAEAFFQRGEALAGAHPDLYAVLAAYFDIETASRRPAGHRTPARPVDA